MRQPDDRSTARHRATAAWRAGRASGQRPGARMPCAVLCLLLALAALLAGAPPAAGPSEGELEYKIKAVYLLNFTRFVEWPQSSFAAADSPFRVCVAGPDPFGKLLDEVFHGEMVEKHPFRVERLAPEAAPRECHLLFIARSEAPAARRLLLQTAGRPVLTVGETEGFIDAGGAVRFFVESGRVRFEINPEAPMQAGLKVSSRLLSVARLVRARPRREGSN